MHIEEGILSPPVLATATLCAAAGVAIGLKKMDPQNIPRVGVLSATFFIATLIHIPFGVGSVHFILNGLLGILLGWVAFPAIFIGLTLQALFFGYGGLSVLGVNTLTMALPAVLCYYLFRPTLDAPQRLHLLWFLPAAALLFPLLALSLGAAFHLIALAMAIPLAFFAMNLAVHYFNLKRDIPAGLFTGILTGACAVVGSGLLFAAVLLLSGREFWVAASGILAAHLPLMFLEGVATATILSFLLRVRPEVFDLEPLPEANNA